MVEALRDQIQSFLGVGAGAEHVAAAQTGLRTVLVYALTLALVRIANKRFLSEATAFDVVVAIMLGSIMSKAVDGSTPLHLALLAGAVLLGMHWVFGVLAFHTDWFGPLVKGERVLLIKDGEIQEEGMRRANVTLADLAQVLRLQTNGTDPSKVRLAYLERNGEISVVPQQDEARIFDVSVEDGVQTVRIKLD
jgi:uncharacterized membrane protein YcaP (DUF421 family)